MDRCAGGLVLEESFLGFASCKGEFYTGSGSSAFNFNDPHIEDASNESKRRFFANSFDFNDKGLVPVRGQAKEC